MSGSMLHMKWGRILLGALFAELVLFAIAMLFYALPGSGDALLYVVPPACLVATLYFGYWAARGAGSRFIAHGALVGLVAAVAYIALTWGKDLPAAYTISHFLKIIGGVTGGYLARRKS